MVTSHQHGADHDHSAKETVLLVGAGIVNLITAEYLATRGFHVRLVDQAPDPRYCKDWTRMGITNGGGNARMFTNTEADNYNEKGSKIYQDMQSIFRKTTRQGGWSVKQPADFTAAELAWVKEFEEVPPSLAQTVREDIHAINQEAGKLWAELMYNTPQLFEGVEYRKDIVRMYVEQVALNAAVQLHRRLNALVQSPPTENFLETHPSFRAAAESDHLAGGLTVEGFTVNIHPFAANLMKRITNLGGELVWGCRVTTIQRTSDGQVTSLQSDEGELHADHYVISPGVNGNALLKGTESENMMQGVLGVWLQIPNLHPRTQLSIKIHRRGHLVEDINITVAKDVDTGEDILMFGGGYGYIGLDRPAPDSPELAALFDELEEVARIYFPKAHTVAKERGTLWPGGQRKYCIRPFTPTGLGLFEKIPAASGGQLIITGGNNTGGFAQAPAIARAVHRALIGEHDPMHDLFHPARGKIATTSETGTSQRADPLSVTRADPQQPLRLLLLCSDGPQHSYLRYRLDKIFPGYHCIQETHEGQVRQLIQKRRMVDAYYMKYHTLRRQVTGHNKQRRAYFDRLTPKDHEFTEPDLVVDTLNCRKVWDAVEKWQPELTIVSGTKYIGKKLTERAGLMINLHIGHLPEYKGNHCIFFALYDGAVDKVAATLHQLTLTLDGGNMLDTVSPTILPSDNEESLYARCVHMAMDRVVEHAESFAEGKPLKFVKQENIGTVYRHRDRTPGKELYLWWKMRVGGTLTRAKQLQG